MIYITTFVLLAFASFTSLSVCVWSMEVETLYTLEDFELMRSRSDKMVLGLFKVNIVIIIIIILFNK